jgi:hypothetical protein
MTFNRSNIRAAKLTPEQVVVIRELYNAGRTQRELCQAYGVSKETIGRIVRGESWIAYGGPGEHRGATELPVEANLDLAAHEQIARQPPTAQTEAEIQASLARTMAKLGMTVDKPSEGQNDDLSTGSSALLADGNEGRGRERDSGTAVPSGNDGEHQRGEAGGADTSADGPSRPAGEGEG